MLVVSRKENEWIKIEPIEGLDPNLTLREVFTDGAVVVRVVHVGRRVRLVIDAPAALKIWRGPQAGTREPVAVEDTPTATAGSQRPSP